MAPDHHAAGWSGTKASSARCLGACYKRSVPTLIRALATPLTAVPNPVLPGCKSSAQRALVLAGCRTGRSRLTGVTGNADVAALVAVLGANGRPVQEDMPGELSVAGRPIARGERWRADVGESGTAARLLLAVVPLAGGVLELDGAVGLRARPMHAAVRMLRAAGVVVSGEALPLVADGSGLATNGPRRIEVDASVTTQVASGAMLALALGEGGEVQARRAAAVGYLELTAGVLQQLGVPVEVENRGELWQARVGRAESSGFDYAVPRDASARTFGLGLAALHGLPAPAALAATSFARHPELAVDADLAILSAPGDDERWLRGLAARPDAVPMLAVLAATRRGRTWLPSLPNLRHKESDRLAALVQALRALGAMAEVVEDGLAIQGPVGPAQQPQPVPAPADHRIVMALAVLGSALPGGLVLEPAAAVAKSWPGFWDWLRQAAHVDGA